MNLRQADNDAYLDPESIDRDFISLGGTYVHVQDFVDMWNGKRDVMPQLSASDRRHVLLVSGRAGPAQWAGTSSLGESSQSEDVAPFFARLLPESFYINRARKKKARELWDLINRYKREKGLDIENKTKNAGNILSMQSVLDAIDRGGVQYSTIGEFLATYVAASPTLANAELLKGALSEMDELTGEVTPKSHFVNKQSAQKIGESVEENRCALIAEALRMDERSLRHVPMILLERAALEHGMSKDDLHSLSNLKKMDSPIPSLINEIRVGILLTGMLTAINGMMFSFDQLMMQTGLEITVLGAFLQFAYNVQARKTPLDLQHGEKKYGKQYKKLENEIAKIKKTGLGKLQISLVREIILAVYETDDLGKVEEIGGYIDGISRDPALTAAFEEYCNLSVGSEEFDTYEGTMKILHEFEAHLEHTRSATAEIAEAHGERRAADTAGLRGMQRPKNYS